MNCFGRQLRPRGSEARAALRSPLVVFALPNLGSRFMTTNSTFWGTTWHYNAILMPVLFLILFGIIEFGSMIWMQNDMTNAAREGARKAAVRGGTTAQAATTACGCLQGLGPTFSITATRACTIPAGATTGVGEVTVNVVVNKSSASLMNTFFSFGSGNLTTSTWGGQIGASVTMRQEDNCSAAETPGPTSCSTSGGTLSCN